MADIVSAGSFVGAVLEQAGYLTQGRFMESFKDFFRDAGALVYFIAAVGGLISVMLFGSFRAAQYLLIGPALYWFLVGPTTPINGVVAQLGGGEQRGFVGSKDSAGDRDKVLNTAGMPTSADIKVSQAFWLFVKPTNDFVKQFVDVMLKNEDGSDLAVGSKVRGLEMISRALPNKSESIHLLENDILKHCMDTYSMAMGAAESYIKTSINRGISQNNAVADSKRNNKNFDTYKQKFLTAAENTFIQINDDTPTLRDMIIANGQNSQGGSALLRSLYNQEQKAPIDIISCATGWNIYLEKIWKVDSVNIMPGLLNLASGEWHSEEAMQQACEELTRKMYDDMPGGVGSTAKGGKCDLVPGIALSLLWNHMSRRDTFQRVLQRHSSDNDPLNNVNQAAIVGLTSLIKNKTFDEIVTGDGLAQYSNSMGGYHLGVAVNAIQRMGKDKFAKVKEQFEATQEWTPAVTLNLIQGLNQSEQIDLPIYEMTRLRQQIFTWALQLPYFQGLILYIISVAYPFAALIVLLPGRAAGFLNVPLAWLWVKSWDIGFAAVILLEKIMYNMLPNWSVNPTLREGPWTYDKLPTVLGEGYNFSHVQGVGYHYSILSTVTLAIPAIMGAMTLKAKKAVLSSFVDAASNQARDAGARAAAAHSISASTERAEILYKIGGFAKQGVVLNDGGLEGGLKGGSALSAAVMPSTILGVNELAKNGISGKAALSSFGLNAAKTGAAATGDLLSRYSKGVQAQAQFESDYRAAFDPLLGRFGAIQMAADAAAAALDGAGARVSGGFETNNPKANAIAAYNALTDERLQTLIDISKNAGELKGRLMLNAASSAQTSISAILEGEPSKIGAMDIVKMGAGVITAANYASENPFNFEAQGARQLVRNAYSVAEANSEGYMTPRLKPGSTDEIEKVPQNAFARMWSVVPETFVDEKVQKAVAAIDENTGTAGHVIKAIYEKGAGLYTPGGNTFTGSMLEGMGGNRRTFQFTQEQSENGIVIPPPTNEPGYAIRQDENFRRSALSKMLNIGNPDLIFENIQIQQEIDDRKQRTNEYNVKLETTVGRIMALENFTPVNTTNLEMAAKELVQQAKEIQEKDRAAGNGLFVPLPPNIERTVEIAPAAAMETLNNWYFDRQASAKGEFIIQGTKGKPVVVSQEQLVPSLYGNRK